MPFLSFSDNMLQDNHIIFLVSVRSQHAQFRFGVQFPLIIYKYVLTLSTSGDARFATKSFSEAEGILARFPVIKTVWDKPWFRQKDSASSQVFISLK